MLIADWSVVLMDERLFKLLGNDESIYPHFLEQKFSRVFNKILELVETPHIDAYLSDLMVDKRSGDRAGFPPEVASEIIRLSNYFSNIHEQGEEVSAWDDVPEYKRNEIERLGYDFSSNGLLKSVEEGHLDAVQVFLSCGVDLEVRDERNWTPLMISSFNGNEEFALLLIKCGAKINAHDKNGYTPLHWAAFNGFANVVKLLLQKEADPNVLSDFGWTALMQAATRGHLLACTYLIASGADVNLATHDGWTALHKASNNGHFEIVKLLLDKGANRYAKYQDGNLPIDLAVKTGHTDIVDLLNTFESKKPLNLKQDIQ
jgi:hypothetical protein